MSEEKKLKRPRGTGSIYRQPGSRFFWVAYFKDGERVRESTGAETITAAREFLKKKLGKVASANFVSPKI